MSADDQLLPHEKRVVAEHAELADRVQKLHDFIETSPVYKAQPAADKALLRTQRTAMRAYEFALRQRIARFERPGDKFVVYQCEARRTPTNPLGEGYEWAYTRLRNFNGTALCLIDGQVQTPVLLDRIAQIDAQYPEAFCAEVEA